MNQPVIVLRAEDHLNLLDLEQVKSMMSIEDHKRMQTFAEDVLSHLKFSSYSEYLLAYDIFMKGFVASYVRKGSI